MAYNKYLSHSPTSLTVLLLLVVLVCNCNYDNLHRGPSIYDIHKRSIGNKFIKSKRLLKKFTLCRKVSEKSLTFDCPRKFKEHKFALFS